MPDPAISDSAASAAAAIAAAEPSAAAQSALTAAHLLTRRSHKGRGAAPLALTGELALERARAHEVCGTARRTLALMLASKAVGPVMWIRPRWTPERLHAEGILTFLDPGRVLTVEAKRPEDLLWSMEEILRSGLVSLVVTDLPGTPGLTAVRRLHLAAETGAAEGKVAPVGVVLTTAAGGAPGVETRWSLDPAHGEGGVQGWRLSRLRARTAPPRTWRLEWGREGATLHA